MTVTPKEKTYVVKRIKVINTVHYYFDYPYGPTEPHTVFVTSTIFQTARFWCIRVIQDSTKHPVVRFYKSPSKTSYSQRVSIFKFKGISCQHPLQATSLWQTNKVLLLVARFLHLFMHFIQLI